MARWFARPKAMFISWIAYWVALFVVACGPAALAIWRATRASHHKSSVNAALGNNGFVLSVIDRGVTTYTASVHLLTAALWIAGPPLVLWLVWALTSPRRERVGAEMRQ